MAYLIKTLKSIEDVEVHHWIHCSRGTFKYLFTANRFYYIGNFSYISSMINNYISINHTCNDPLCYSSVFWADFPTIGPV